MRGGKPNTTAEFIAKARAKHGDRYDYSAVKYVNNNTNVVIICRRCGKSFEQRPFNHAVFETGCPTCALNDSRKTSEDFIRSAQAVHGDKYDYSSTKYFNARTKVAICCKACGTIFLQLPRSHVCQRSGCPRCKSSRGEGEIAKILDVAGIKYERAHMFAACKGKRNRLRFDFFVPDHNACIEFDGRQHYDRSSQWWSESLHDNDLKKDEYCKANGIRMIRITTDDIDRMKSTLFGFIIELLKRPT